MATLLWTPSNSHSLNLNLNGKQSPLKLNANPSLHFNRRFRRFNTAISCNSTNHNDADTKPQSQSQAIQLYSQIERTFGCVIDVRIPCQHERMFGFVTFVYPETVKTILEEGNPHYVRGSRVLVKPYKERSKLVDRKNQYRFEQHHVRYSPQYADFNAEITSSPISCGNARYQTRLRIDEQNRFFELQRRRLAMLQVAQRSFSSPPHLGINMNGPRVSDDNLNVQLQPTESFSYAGNFIANNTDEDSREGVHQPDSAFSFRIDTTIM